MAILCGLGAFFALAGTALIPLGFGLPWGLLFTGLGMFFTGLSVGYWYGYGSALVDQESRV